MGYLQLKPWELAVYTVSDLFKAYSGWKEVHVHWPWERVRALCFHIIKPYAPSLRNWEEIFPLEIDSIRFRKELETSSVKFAQVRAATPEEKALYDRITKGRNGK